MNINEQVSRMKGMMGLSENSGRYQFSQDIKDDPDYIQFKKDAEYKDDTGQSLTFGTPRADGNDHYVNKEKYSRVKPDDGVWDLDDEMDEELEPGLNKSDGVKYGSEEMWKDRSDILHRFSQYAAALSSSVNGTLKFLNKVDMPITKDTIYSKNVNQTFYEHILYLKETVDNLITDLEDYRKRTENLAPNE